MLWSTESCRNKVSADQCHNYDHIAGSVAKPIEVTVFLKLTADKVMAFPYELRLMYSQL